ncbi:hypothetical protein BSI_27390 [Bacillus inaquosorum KCTC 13429]|uniref:Uncharacterized protein n=1 Tax=Bacillus inaquosorum KCTC 13429 TaxID=1236548 RepID=A0A9W5PCZ4_9BACI|nr:hypothetical protein BSI_27390 [Bacillus inaquosorum KCTC 13429]
MEKNELFIYTKEGTGIRCLFLKTFTPLYSRHGLNRQKHTV